MAVKKRFGDRDNFFERVESVSKRVTKKRFGDRNNFFERVESVSKRVTKQRLGDRNNFFERVESVSKRVTKKRFGDRDNFLRELGITCPPIPPISSVPSSLRSPYPLSYIPSSPHIHQPQHIVGILSDGLF